MAVSSANRQVLLREQVYEGVKDAIVSGALRPGDIINEAQLAKDYGISRTPVREALCLLSFQGLLQPLPRTGYIVSPLTVRDIQEAYHLRLLLEVEAIGLAVERITEEEIRQLERLADGRTGPEMRIVNREFHSLIADASGSGRLARLIRQLLDEMDRMLYLDPHISAPTGPYEHTDMVDALRRRDKKTAQQAMRRHIEEGRARLLQLI